ncbi:MAG: hypothetical protein IT371_31680 [Deltaproteobacteria bacterium]|nr:hypothetical protein [Deltaproteobacteria bacterium]
MRTHTRPVPLLLLLGAFGSIAPSSAEARNAGSPSPAAQLEAVKADYSALCRARAKRWELRQRLAGSGSSGLIYSDRSGVPWMSIYRENIQALATWGSEAECLAKSSNPGRTREAIASCRAQLQGVNELLGSLPHAATGGFVIGDVFNNAWLKAEAYRQLTRKMGEIVDAVDKLEAGKCQVVEQRIARNEALLMAHVDEQYVTERPLVRQKLRGLSGKALFETALRMIEQVNDVTHSKQIRHEEVERGEAHMTASGEASWGAEAETFGELTGRRTGRSRAGGSSTTRMSADSKYTRDQLLLKASTYKVNVWNVHSGGEQDTEALTPVEARLLIGQLLDLSQVYSVLKLKSPTLAARLTPWIEHSQIDFAVPGDYRSAKYTVGMSHVARDAISLEQAGVVTPEFAGELDRSLRQPLEDALTGSSLLR